jgi:uncharacterized small protein (DUF1192 family)
MNPVATIAATWDQVVALGLANKVAIGAAALSVTGAVGTVILTYLGGSRLEKRKAVLQKELEDFKASRQNELEQRKASLQQELEDFKASRQNELEQRKASLQQELEDFKASRQHELEQRKSALQKDLELFKSDISAETSLRDARLAYEFDARKRLYAEVEPLLFQLFDAAEGAYHGVASLARTAKRGELIWLASEGYYSTHTVYRLFKPLSIYRLLQRSTTLVDLNLDHAIRQRYQLLKECYIVWTDDFGVKDLSPELDYDPNHPDAAKLEVGNPAVFARQGCYIGKLDRLATSMIVDGEPPRVMTYGEFEHAVTTDNGLQSHYEEIRQLFRGFTFQGRPVLTRLLLAYAALMHMLLSVFAAPKTVAELNKMCGDFLREQARKDLSFDDGAITAALETIEPYVLRRLAQAMTESYVRF